MPQLLDVVDGLAGQQRMRAAGVVADHAAERAPAVRRGIGAEGEVVRSARLRKRIEDDARLHARERASRIELQDAVHVLREVEHHGDVAALAGEAGAGAPRQDRRADIAGTPRPPPTTSSASRGTTRPIGTWR